MKIKIMNIEDIYKVLDLYINYYNKVESSSWNEKTAYKRIHQVMSMEDSFSLIVEDKTNIIGFAMGYFKQYDDIIGYTLEEIVIDYKFQNRGYGTALLKRLENYVKEMGVSCVELKAVNDKMHDNFYGKSGYQDSSSFIDKVKWLD